MVTLMVGSAGAGELTFELPDKEKMCFYEFVQKGVECVLEYQVQCQHCLLRVMVKCEVRGGYSARGACEDSCEERGNLRGGVRGRLHCVGLRRTMAAGGGVL